MANGAKYWLAVWFGLFLMAFSMLVAVQAADAQSSTLKSLIDGARREGQLNVSVVTSQGAKGGEALGEAFKRRFGLGKAGIEDALVGPDAGDPGP